MTIDYIVGIWDQLDRLACRPQYGEGFENAVRILLEDVSSVTQKVLDARALARHKENARRHAENEEKRKAFVKREYAAFLEANPKVADLDELWWGREPTS